MAKIALSKYLGQLRIESEHLGSGQKIISDAPLDNAGKGEAFSPTDLVATALAKCALTLMGIKAREAGFDLEDAEADVSKQMASNPRRIESITVHIRLKANCDAKMRKVLEGTARTCPVAKSLAANLKQEIQIEWL